MASKYWIKLYHEILDDPKMGRLTDRQYRRVIELFLLAGDCELDGQLPGLDDINFRLRYPAGLSEDIDALLGFGILTRNRDGALLVTRWLDRQTAMSDVERSRRWRGSARKVSYYRHENATDRDIDIDIDTDTEVERDLDADGSGLQEQAADIPTPQRLPGARAMGIGSAEPYHTAEQEQAADIPTPLRPRGARAMGKRDAPPARGMYPSSGSWKLPKSVHLRFLRPQRSAGIGDEGLVKLFVERTGLPLYLGGEEKWARALERMKQAEVDEADLEQAIDECRSKGLTIASLASVVNPAIIARAKRKAGRPEEDYRRYLKGEYGDFGR